MKLQPEPPPDGVALVRRSREFVAPFRGKVAGIVLLALVLAALNAADPLVLKYLFDSLTTPAGGAGALVTAVVLLLGIEVGRTALNAWLTQSTAAVRTGVDYAIRERLVRKLQELPLTWHDRQGVGATINHVNQVTAGFVNAFGAIAFTVLPTAVYLVLSIWAMWRLDWRLALLVIAFTPLPALIGGWAAREQALRERTLLAHWSRTYGRLNEALAGIRMVKLFGTEQLERDRFLAMQRQGNEVVLRGAGVDSRTGAARALAAALARLAAIGVGGWFVARGEITLGTMLAFLGYVGGLFGPVQGLTDVYQTIRKAAVSLEGIYEMLDARDDNADRADARPLEDVRGEIRFEDVQFTHGDGTVVLRGVDLAVRPGETLALVGASGAGKSTLVALLQRLYPITGGRILVDGHSIDAVTKASLRRHFASVSQDIHLFNDTVRANISYGRVDASDEEIEAAARTAQAHDFIMALPEGYDTVVGERGGRLSGGQRQRIAIARALLRDAPILLLDEATSALDTVSERLVQETLALLQRGRTTICVAHRMSTVEKADRIAVLRDGRVAALGTHAELLATSEEYAALVGEIRDREDAAADPERLELVA